MAKSKTMEKPSGKRYGFEYFQQDRNRFTHRESLGVKDERLSYVVEGKRYFVMTNSFSNRSEAETFAKKHKGTRKNLHYRIVKKIGTGGKEHFHILVRYTK